MDDFYLNARGNVLSKPVKPPVKTTKYVFYYFPTFRSHTLIVKQEKH